MHQYVLEYHKNMIVSCRIKKLLSQALYNIITLDNLGAADMGSGIRASHRKAQKFDICMDRKLLQKESQKVMSLCLHSFI
jgi:hypothetical protein